MGHMDEQIADMINTARKEQQGASGLPKSDLHNYIESESGLELYPLKMLDGERIAFAERPLLNDKISIWLPRTFTEMGEREIELKYPSSYRPPLILTDPTGRSIFLFNLTPSELTDEELEAFTSEMIYILHHTQKLTEWYADGVCKVYGRRVGYCEFMTPALNTRLYNLTFLQLWKGMRLYAHLTVRRNVWIHGVRSLNV